MESLIYPEEKYAPKTQEEANQELALLYKALKCLYSCKLDIKKANPSNLFPLANAYNNANNGAYYGQQYLNMRKPRYAFEDSK